MINIYCAGGHCTLRAAESGLGYLPVRSILEGKLLFQPQQADRQPEEEKRLAPADEQIVLHSMEGTLLARRLCLRQGGDLVFPSYCGRERPEGPVPPQCFVSYTIHGFLDDIYATLVVCLAHCGAFHLAELWRDAADFKTVAQKKTLGIRLLRREDGRGELIAHASGVSQEEQVLFANYIHEHLNEKSTSPVERLRRYNCPSCLEPVMNRELAMERLQKSGAEAKIRCQRCDNWVPLWDDLETLFASPLARAMVEEWRNLEQGQLDARRKGKLLVLAVAAHILRADQKYIEVPGDQDEGIDLELEATENGRGTGKKMFLQLKAGNSHLQARPDGTDVFLIEEQSWVKSWSLFSEVGPVMLVIGTFAASGDRGTSAEKWSFDQIRWMEIGQALRTLSNGGTIPVKEIPFKGTRLDDQDVYRWTRSVLSGNWRDK